MKAKTTSISQTRFAAFFALVGDLVTGPAIQKGAWITFASPFSWPECADTVKRAKAEGFKSTFYRGNKIGVRAEHLA